VNTLLLKYQCRHTLPEFIPDLRQAVAAPADTLTVLLEVVKFLATLGLILATGLIMLLAG
jgi:hypothetical protein